MRRPANPLANERGVALVLTLLLLTVFLTLAMYGVLFSTLDGRIASNQITGTQALNTAEAGLLRALHTINRAGVRQFQTDVVDQWSTLFTPNPRQLPNAPTLTYHVAVAAEPLDPTNAGTLTVTASGPGGAHRTVVGAVRRVASPDGRGALYLTADYVNPDFTGAVSAIDGNDHDLARQPVPGGAVKPGIATRNDTVSSRVRSELTSAQAPAVRGAGFSLSPMAPSVVTTGGPNGPRLDQIINDVLSRPGVQTTATTDLVDGSVLGDCSAPQITHLTASSVALSGRVSGCGILVADGFLRLSGTLDFTGWIFVRGDVDILAPLSGAGAAPSQVNILGALWTSDFDVSAGGSATLRYSSAALTLADTAGGGVAIPRAMTLTSWMEVY